MNTCECCAEPATGERCDLCAPTGTLCVECEGCSECCDCDDIYDLDAMYDDDDEY